MPWVRIKQRPYEDIWVSQAEHSRLADLNLLADPSATPPPDPDDAATARRVLDVTSETRKALAAAFQPRSGRPTIAAIGDSLTANGQGIIDPDTLLPDWGFSDPRSYMQWANILSGGRFVWAGSAATGGITPQQILDTHAPTIVALRPTYCVVLSGQNQMAQLDAIEQTWDRLLDAGVTPILCTNVPSTTAAALDGLNQFIRRSAITRGLPLVDFHRALVDPVTGLYKAGLAADGVHPTERGARVMGQALADVLADLIPTPVAAEALVDYAVPNGRLLLNDPLFLTQAGTAPIVLPGNWWNGTTNVTAALASDPACVGRKVTVTQTDATFTVVSSWIGDIVAGHRYQVALVLGGEGEAVGGFWGYRWVNANNGANYLHSRFNLDVEFGAVAVHEFVAPPRVTSDGTNNQRFDLITDSASGTKVSAAQVTIRDLTAMGLS